MGLEVRYQITMLEFDEGALDFIAGIAAARHQDVVEMVQRAGEHPEVYEALMKQPTKADRDAITFEQVARLVTALPTIDELSRASSGIHARLTTALGMELRVFTCDPMGSAWTVRGVLLFPSEPLDFAMQEQFVVDDFGGHAAFLTLDAFEAALFGPNRDGHVTVFKIFDAELGHAPGVAGA